MKKFFNCFRNVLAVFGLIFVLLIIYQICTKQYHDINITKTDLGLYGKRVDLLRASGPYAKDTAEFSIRIIQDTVRAKEIREYFQLDTLYADAPDTWAKALAIAKFVTTNIPHDNQKEYPKSINAIGLWEYTKNVAPAFNCRLHGILAFELFLASGIDAKYITCMPEDADDNDCHVVNEVWLPELGKWAMVDTDMGGHYVSDMEGIPLSLKEMRERYISGEKMMVYPAYENGSSRKDWYYAYMAKNTYWFSCWGELSYYQEDYAVEGVLRDHYVNLVPHGFEPFRVGGGNTVTTNAEQFWAPPVH